MRIEIEIPKEFEGDYNADRFSDFFSRVICDIKDGVLCGNYEKETALMLRTAFHTSKIAYDVEAVVAELEKESFEDSCGRAILLSDVERIVRGKERKYCGNCKHQPEPFTTCDWLKLQPVVFKECPLWERQE